MNRARMFLQYGLFTYVFASAMYGVYAIFKELGKFLADRSTK